MKSKRLIRIVSMVMLIILSMSIFSTALAASKSYKGIGSKTYTITTGKKDATLKITQSAGKVNATAWKNPLKKTTKTVTKSMYGEFDIKVTQGFGSTTKTINYPTNSSASFTLKKNSTYTVTVTYRGFSGQLTGAWNPVWKTSPTVKLSVNNSAKIK